MFEQINPVEQVTKQITEQASSFDLEDLYNDFKQPSLNDVKTLASADPVSALALKGLDKLNINPVDSMLQGFSLDMSKEDLTKNAPEAALIPQVLKPRAGSDCTPQDFEAGTGIGLRFAKDGTEHNKAGFEQNLNNFDPGNKDDRQDLIDGFNTALADTNPGKASRFVAEYNYALQRIVINQRY